MENRVKCQPNWLGSNKDNKVFYFVFLVIGKWAYRDNYLFGIISLIPIRMPSNTDKQYNPCCTSLCWFCTKCLRFPSCKCKEIISSSSILWEWLPHSVVKKICIWMWSIIISLFLYLTLKVMPCMVPHLWSHHMETKAGRAVYRGLGCTVGQNWEEERKMRRDSRESGGQREA